MCLAVRVYDMESDWTARLALSPSHFVCSCFCHKVRCVWVNMYVCVRPGLWWSWATFHCELKAKVVMNFERCCAVCAARALAVGDLPLGYEELVPLDHPNLRVELMPSDDGTTVYDYVFAGTPAAPKVVVVVVLVVVVVSGEL